MADFLVALADFDRQRLWVELGHASVFYYLHRDLKLSKGAAHYRKVAARLIQKFPEVVAPFREGKLCITTVVELARVITPENSADVLPRFFYLSKQEAKAVAVEICPAAVVPRREVVTKVVTEVVTELPRAAPFHPGETPPPPPPAPAPAEQRASFEPLTPNLQRLHMTVSRQFLDKLEAARKGQGHAQPGASAEKVLEAALDLLLAQQAKRRAEVSGRRRTPAPPRTPATSPPRCGGRCGHATTESANGRSFPEASAAPRCAWRSTTSSREGRAGPPRWELQDRFASLHNQLAARQVYGDKLDGPIHPEVQGGTCQAACRWCGRRSHDGIPPPEGGGVKESTGSTNSTSSLRARIRSSSSGRRPLAQVDGAGGRPRLLEDRVLHLLDVDARLADEAEHVGEHPHLVEVAHHEPGPGRRLPGHVHAVRHAPGAQERLDDAHRLPGDGVLGLRGGGADVVSSVDVRELGELAVEVGLALLRLSGEDVGAHPDASGPRQIEERRLVHHLGPRRVEEDRPRRERLEHGARDGAARLRREG